MRAIRILIADDSPSVTTLLAAIFSAAAGIEVVGRARDGREAVALTHTLEPDLVTMDIRMPVMDGVEATARIMESRPTPIVVITGATRDEDLRAGFRAIEAGALAVIDKPVGLSHADFESIRTQLVGTVRAMAEIKVIRRTAGRVPGAKSHAVPAATAAAGLAKSVSVPEIVGIGASTGGPQALRTILSVLPGDFPVPMVVVQHMSRGFVTGLTRWLTESTRLEVKVAEDFEPLAPGHVYFAPDGFHLLVRRSSGHLLARLGDDAPVSGFRPAVTPLMDSIAAACPGRGVGVVLTGMGDDGAAGLLAMRSAGCHTIAQDRATSIVFGMPGSAIRINAVERVLALDRIGSALVPTVAQRRAPISETEVNHESLGR
jgi:two-component system chemotaxis response regulator CheB